MNILLLISFCVTHNKKVKWVWNGIFISLHKDKTFITEWIIPLNATGIELRWGSMPLSELVNSHIHASVSRLHWKKKCLPLSLFLLLSLFSLSQWMIRLQRWLLWCALSLKVTTCYTFLCHCVTSQRNRFLELARSSCDVQKHIYVSPSHKSYNINK